MPRDRSYKWEWHPDHELIREPDHVGDDIPAIRSRRQMERDTRAAVSAAVASDRDITRRPLIACADQLLTEAAIAISTGRQKTCIELLGRVAEYVVEAGGTSTVEWFPWPPHLADGAMQSEYVERTMYFCVDAKASLRRGRLTDVLCCIHDATLSASCAERDLIEAEEREEEAKGAALRIELVAEGEELANNPGRSARRRMRQLRSEWNNAPWMVDDAEYRLLARRFNRAAHAVFASTPPPRTESAPRCAS